MQTQKELARVPVGSNLESMFRNSRWFKILKCAPQLTLALHLLKLLQLLPCPPSTGRLPKTGCLPPWHRPVPPQPTCKNEGICSRFVQRVRNWLMLRLGEAMGIRIISTNVLTNKRRTCNQTSQNHFNFSEPTLAEALFANVQSRMQYQGPLLLFSLWLTFMHLLACAG